MDVPRVINDNHVREKWNISPVTNQIIITAPKTIDIQMEPATWSKWRHGLVMTESAFETIVLKQQITAQNRTSK
jgi:hypothetical protein